MAHKAVGLNQHTIFMGVNTIETPSDLGHLTLLMAGCRGGTVKFFVILKESRFLARHRTNKIASSKSGLEHAKPL
jgi:hypothetical protein